ncbi:MULTISPECIES: hypothetical protein [unclassified Bradyrhizobium]|nr:MULTISPECIES: hypothetical protein [unclassified Bradyrhizobium]
MKKATARSNELEVRSDTSDHPLPLMPPPAVKANKGPLPNDSKMLGYL